MIRDCIEQRINITALGETIEEVSKQNGNQTTYSIMSNDTFDVLDDCGIIEDREELMDSLLLNSKVLIDDELEYGIVDIR
jgi:hypothetical protein